MRSCIYLFILLISCNAAPVHKSKQTPKTLTSFTVNSNFDSVWNKLLLYSFKKEYKIKEMDKSAGTMIMTIKDVPISYLDKDVNQPYSGSII